MYVKLFIKFLSFCNSRWYDSMVRRSCYADLPLLCSLCSTGAALAWTIFCVTSPSREPSNGMIVLYDQRWRDATEFRSTEQIQIVSNPEFTAALTSSVSDKNTRIGLMIRLHYMHTCIDTTNDSSPGFTFFTVGVHVWRNNDRHSSGEYWFEFSGFASSSSAERPRARICG